MSKNSQYWQNRFKQLEETEHASSVEEYAKIQEQFDIAQRRIQKEINSWYGRFAKENGVSMEAARKMLDEKQMAELKWDVNEYIKHGQQNALDPKWMHQLENASARVHISRLEAIKLLTQAECEKLYGNLTDDITAHLSHQYEDAYYHTAYEIARGTNIGVNFAAVNERKLEKIINKPWAADGKNFAVRLGENKANLINNIHKSLVQMTLTGENPDKAISMLSRTMNGDKARAGRIIMTESAYFTELANKDSYNELGVQQYEIIATLDSHTSEICQEMDGKVFDTSIFEPGVTAPPFHPNCRSTTAPYFDDNFDSVGERAARDENNKVYYVPADTTYKKWAKGFLGEKAEPEKTGFMELNLQFFAKKYMAHPENITQEYISRATPGIGNKIKEDKFTNQNGEEEYANWIYNLFGGDITLLEEKQIEHHLNPDYLWNGKLWDLKRLKSDKYGTIEKRVRHAIDQIENNPGGIMLDFSDSPMSLEEANEMMNKIAKERLRFAADVIISKNGKYIVMRY